ncbi:hypothetical protein [Nostoc sp. 106C]|uniref:hypothetical protein n=1 Tax=Nostoc sp. 106C TaxID=1932667 RepID=UPI000A39EC1D|nr:hypothetical protein [Nostoc sp. 106C]OUL19684.1 hypothetical protein BV375_31645 [Nostoc sp. 106C]
MEEITATQTQLHSAEESKHIRLFRRFTEEFEIGFGSRCEGIGLLRNHWLEEAQHTTLHILMIEQLYQFEK